MHCLLCHEKIPRLRVWRTKSEFCCDEHAALYKKQTLERLLVDPSANQNGGQPSLPEPPEPEEFELDEVEQAEVKPRAPQPKGQGAHEDFQFWERFDRAAEAKVESVELPPPADDEAEESVDELWRLADEVRQDRSGEEGVRRQTAEEALEALRQLANRAAGDAEKPPEKKTVFEMPGASEPPEPPRSLDELPNLDQVREEKPLAFLDDEEYEADARAWEQPAAETYAPPPSEGRQYVGEEPQESSILDQLMADPLESWNRGRGGVDELEEQQEVVSSEELEASDLDEAEALAESADELDLSAPEPNWDFEDSSAELSALKASLASSGAPPVTYEGPPLPEDVDMSPVEPDWEELEALDLSDADIEPPEPEIEDGGGEEAGAKIVPFPAPREAAEAPDHHEEHPAKEAGRRTTRFRPVSELVAIEPDIAEAAWTSDGTPIDTEGQLIASDAGQQAFRIPDIPAALGPRASSIRGRDAVLAPDVPAAEAPGGSTPRELRQPDDIAPPASALFLPGGAAAGSKQGNDLSMHDGSVDIEPTAALDAPEAASGVSEKLEGPFEPAGLFFDMTLDDSRGPAEDSDGEESGVAGAAAGRQGDRR